MAGITVPTPSRAATAATGSGTTGSVAVAIAPSTRAYLAPAVAAAVGALSGVLATWALVATQTLQMSL